MTKILFDCPTCGNLRTIRLDGPGAGLCFNCSACSMAYELKMSIRRFKPVAGPTKPQTPKLPPLKKVVFDNKDPKKETKSDETVDNGRTTD